MTSFQTFTESFTGGFYLFTSPVLILQRNGNKWISKLATAASKPLPSPWGIWTPHLIRCFLGPEECPPQVGPWSVRSFLHNAQPAEVTDKQTLTLRHHPSQQSASHEELMQLTFEHSKAGFLRHKHLHSGAELLPGGLLEQRWLRQTTHEEYVLHVYTEKHCNHRCESGDFFKFAKFVIFTNFNDGLIWS